jgi:hypothetical protein
MKILPEFPRNAARGRCLLDSNISSGPCVEIPLDLDAYNRKRETRFVISAPAICGAAAHFGMVAPNVHADTVAALDEAQAQLAIEQDKVASMLTAFRAWGIPETVPAGAGGHPPSAAPAAPKAKAKPKSELEVDS